MRSIGFFGNFMMGKTSCAMFLSAINNWKVVNYADGIKQILSDYFGLSKEDIERYKRSGEKIEGYKKNIRESLQLIGQTFREIYPEIWINYTMNLPFNKIVGDGRHLAEAEKGDMNVIVWRPGYENKVDHPSEREIAQVIEYVKSNFSEGKIDYMNFHYFIKNDGTLEDLQNKVAKFWEETCLT